MSSSFLNNVFKFVPDYTATHLRRCHSLSKLVHNITAYFFNVICNNIFPFVRNIAFANGHDKYYELQKAIAKKDVNLKIYVGNVRLDSEVRKVTA
jgi:hypothetical protein